MKRKIAVILVAALIPGLVAGCGFEITGSGNLQTEDFAFSDFTRVDVGSTFEVEILQAASYSVSVTADDNLFQYIQVSKEGETLKIGLRPFSIFGHRTLKARVTLPELNGVELSGASRGTVSAFSSNHDLDIQVSGASSLELADISCGDASFDVSGASTVTGELSAANAGFDVSGASTIQLEGSAGDITADVSGASRARFAAFPVNNADITLSGASTCSLELDGRLDADLSGASRLEYSGEPTMGTINTSGASTISEK